MTCDVSLYTRHVEQTSYSADAVIVTTMCVYNEGTNATPPCVCGSRKIARYNSSILAIENLVLWWDSMTTVEKGSPLHSGQLVSMGEAIINRFYLQ